MYPWTKNFFRCPFFLKFQFYYQGDDEVIIDFSDSEFKISSLNSDPSTYIKIDVTSSESLSINDYVGLFYNEELDMTYTFEVQNNMLSGFSKRSGTTSFLPIVKDAFRSNTFMLSGVTFERDTNNQVIAFRIDTDGVKNLRFKKLTTPD